MIGLGGNMNKKYSVKCKTEQAKSKEVKWWCCKAEFGKHEPTCENYKPPVK